MKKKIFALAALPVLFGAAGYGAGHFLAPAPASAHAQQTGHGDRSTAEKALDNLADDGEQHGTAAESHGGSKTHAPAQHDAQLVPAKATKPTQEFAADHGSAQALPKPRDHAPAQVAAKPSQPKKSQPAAVKSAHAPGPERHVPQINGHDVEFGKPAKDAPKQKGVLTVDRLSDAKVVKLGRMTIPVVNAKSVTYVISDIGVSVADLDTAAHYNIAENATRLRDAILVSMHRAAGTSLLKDARINTGELSESLSSDLKENFGTNVEEVLFLSLYKADVPRG